jgi:hypothetical protein
MIRVREERHDCGVEHVGARRPVRILPVKARDDAVISRDVHQRIGSGRARRIAIEVILKQLHCQNVIPQLRSRGGLPEVGCARRREARAAGGDRTREVFDLGQFLRLLRRIKSRRRRGPKLAARRNHPCPPCPCERLEWICPTPETGPGRDLACEDGVGAVGLRARDYYLGHLAPEFQPGGNVARKMHARIQPRLAALLRLARERLRIAREEVAERRRRGARRRVFTWVGRAVGDRERGRDL